MRRPGPREDKKPRTQGGCLALTLQGCFGMRAWGRGLRPSAYPAPSLPTRVRPLRRGPCPCARPLGAARPLPLRGPGPAHTPKPGPPPGHSPRLYRSATCAPLLRLRGLSLVPSAPAPVSLRCGLPCGGAVALAPFARVRWAARAPPGPPLAVRCAASGAA